MGWFPLMGKPISKLLVGIALTIIPAATATAYAQRCHAACEWDCEGWQSDHYYHRCMRACLKECSLPRQLRPGSGRNRQGQFVEVVLRFLTESVGAGVLGGVGPLGFVILRIIKSVRRRHNLRISKELRCRANSLDHQAADLRAEARRREHDI